MLKGGKGLEVLFRGEGEAAGRVAALAPGQLVHPLLHDARPFLPRPQPPLPNGTLLPAQLGLLPHAGRLEAFLT